MHDTGVLIRTQDDHVTSAPRAVNVSIRTAVWMVLDRNEWIRFDTNSKKAARGYPET